MNANARTAWSLTHCVSKETLRASCFDSSDGEAIQKSSLSVDSPEYERCVGSRSLLSITLVDSLRKSSSARPLLFSLLDGQFRFGDMAFRSPSMMELAKLDSIQ